MMRGILQARTLIFAVSACALAVPAAPAAAAQYSYGVQQPETSSAALARHVRTLASDPKDFGALIGAGRAALDLGDTQAAAGFYARADDVNPRSPLPQAGMGAVSVGHDEPDAGTPPFQPAACARAPRS